MKGGHCRRTCQRENKKKYYEQLCASKVDNLHEIDQFPERNSLLKLKQEEVDNLNRPVSIKENGETNSNSPKEKTPGTMRCGWRPQFPHQGQNPCPLRRRVPGPPGDSPVEILNVGSDQC